jgi:ABC-type amino acid transport substrate-binding protein
MGANNQAKENDVNRSIEMKGRPYFLSVGIALSLAVVGAEARSLAEIQETNELRTCIAFVSPPMGKAEPGGCRDHCESVTGDTPDLAAAFAQSLGAKVKPKWISIGWEEQFTDQEGKLRKEDAYTPQLLASGTCDFYATGFVKTPWRSKKLDFVIHNPTRVTVVVMKARREAFRSPVDLGGKKMATYRQTVYEAWALEQNQSAYKEHPVQIQYVADEGESLKAVEDGKADFTLLLVDSALPMLQQSPNTVVAFGVGSVMDWGWSFRKEDKDLQDAAQRFIEAQRAAKESLMNRQFQGTVGMSVNEYTRYVNDLK